MEHVLQDLEVLGMYYMHALNVYDWYGVWPVVNDDGIIIDVVDCDGWAIVSERPIEEIAKYDQYAMVWREK